MEENVPIHGCSITGGIHYPLVGSSIVCYNWKALGKPELDGRPIVCYICQTPSHSKSPYQCQWPTVPMKSTNSNPSSDTIKEYSPISICNIDLPDKYCHKPVRTTQSYPEFYTKCPTMKPKSYWTIRHINNGTETKNTSKTVSTNPKLLASEVPSGYFL